MVECIAEECQSFLNLYLLIFLYNSGWHFHRSIPSMQFLPGCAVYIQLEVLSVIEAGDHDVTLCQVVQTGVWDAANQKVVATDTPPEALDPRTALYTAQLRKDGII